MLLPSEKPSFLHPSSSINSSLISSNGPTSSCIQMTLSHPIMTWKQHHPTWWVTCISRGTASLAVRTTEPMWAPRLVGQPTAQNLNLDLKGRPLQNCWILCLSGNPFRGTKRHAGYQSSPAANASNLVPAIVRSFQLGVFFTRGSTR